MSRLRPVAHAAHGADDGARLAQLLAQGADVDVHGAGLAVVVRAPDLAEQPVAREHHAGAGHEGVEQLELLERQRYLLPVRRHAAALRVYGDAAEGEGAAAPPRPCAAQDGAHAAYHLHHAEGLHEIVVRAGVEARYLVVFLAPGRRHDDGQVPGRGAEAELLQDLQPVLAGEHDVEDDELRRGLFERGKERGPALAALGLKAGGAQGVDLYVPYRRVVLYAVYHHKTSRPL